MKSLDLETLIILISLLLMPVAGYWVYDLDKQIAVSEKALSPKTLNTLIKNIVAKQEEIRLTKRELFTKGSGQVVLPSFFEEMLSKSQAGAQKWLKQQDMQLTEGTPVKVTGKRRKKLGEDIEMTVRFGKSGRAGMVLPRDFINAFIYRCESAAPIWKLRELRIVNSAFASKKQKTVPLETPDTWSVAKLAFARRRPIAK